MNKPHDIGSYGIVLLAAGASTRLGRPKQLLPYKEHDLLTHAVKVAEGVNAAVTVVVVGAEAETLLHELKGFKIKSVVNQQYSDGMASSIRCGVQYILDYYPAITNIIMMVCDQPYVDRAHILNLIARHQATGAKIVASSYHDRNGVPALFSKEIFQELLNLQGDVGAKSIIEKYHTETAAVFLPLGEIDIDTEEAYTELIMRSSYRK